MSIITVLLFVFYCWGIGYSVTRWSRHEEHHVDRFLVNMMVGFAALPIIFALLNFIQYPFGVRLLIDWKVIFLLAALVPAYDFVRHLRSGYRFKMPKWSFSVTRKNIILLCLLVIFAWTFFMYYKGSFAYHWLEDSDPWKHAVGVSYMAHERTLFHNPQARFSSYFDPYPASYNALLAILHQTSSSLNWTLKFFNALMISLYIFFVYYLAHTLFKDQAKALFASLAYAMIPGTLSHFIWSHALAPGILIAGLYCFNRFHEDRSWLVPALATLASFTLTTPTAAAKLIGIAFVFWVGKMISARAFTWRELCVLAVAIMLSLSWWGLEFYRYGGILDTYSAQEGLGSLVSPDEGNGGHASGGFSKLMKGVRAFLDPRSGSESRVYHLKDYFIATPNNVINNPWGIGFAIAVLAIIGIIASILVVVKEWGGKERTGYGVALLMVFIFTFLGLNSVTFNLPIGLFAFRFWMLFAIPVALLAAEGYAWLGSLLRRVGVSTVFLLLIVVPAIFFTSGMQKYQINTSVWAPSAGFEPPYTPDTYSDLQAYEWIFKNIPQGTGLFGLTGYTTSRGIAYDKYFCAWCPDQVAFRATAYNVTPTALHGWMKENGYEYFVIDPTVIKRLGPFEPQEANEYVQRIAESGLFSLAYQTKTVLVLKAV